MTLTFLWLMLFCRSDIITYAIVRPGVKKLNIKMFRITFSKSKTVLFATVPVVSAATSENPAIEDKTAKTEEFVFVETGWDRVRNIFKSS